MGEVKIQPLTDDVDRFFDLKQVYVDQNIYKVLNVRVGCGFVYANLSGVADRNAAELLRGKFLMVDRDNATKLEEGRYFIVDLIGCNVKTELGQEVGKVIDVTEAKTDYFTLTNGKGKTLRFPFLKDLVLSVDVKEKAITVSDKRLKEVCVYED